MNKNLKSALRAAAVVVVAFSAYFCYPFILKDESFGGGDYETIQTAAEPESVRSADSEEHEEILTETEIGGETDSEPDSESDSETDSDSDSDSESDTDSEKDSEKDSESDSAAEPYDGDPILILVNRDHPIPDGYEIELVDLDDGNRIDLRAYPDLVTMLDEMRSEGMNPVIAESFRTTEYQQEIMQERIDGYVAQGYSEEDARTEAEKWVAVPGTSEHELGLAVDINGDDWSVYEWLAANAYKYGFILRYPSGKEDITGIDYEPWHYRYVGHEAAEEIFYGGVCLEEYLAE